VCVATEYVDGGAPIGPRGGGTLGHQSTSSESYARPLPMSATTTPSGAEFLVEGVVVVSLSALMKILRGSASMHLPWSLGSGVV
jgi:hypothetical protein